MSHINRNSEENREYQRNENNFFSQLMRDCLVSYTKNGEKRHIYVICPNYILLVRHDYQFWGTYLDYYIRELKEMITNKGFDYDVVDFPMNALGDYADASVLRKLYKQKKGLK